jgi:hypothetical protein
LQRLDTVVGDAEPIMLKMDIEGHEAKALTGAAATLAKLSLQAILIETGNPVVEALLHDAGFVGRYYDPFARTISEVSDTHGSANLLFVRDVGLVSERVRTARTFRVAGVAV